ncbi:MAG TPA: histidinol-phosphatase [Peptococcaceae bacterium]|nr:histidinol-phosphatase [Peptococcaceae bacterium]
MIFDLHIHTQALSSCSRMSMGEAAAQSKALGLDGICITEHDAMADAREAEYFSNKYGIIILVGCEVNTHEGDILVFGLKEVPKGKLSAQELIDLTDASGGGCIAAHPFRDNGRGAGNVLSQLHGLCGIEAYNGNTKPEHNQQAVQYAEMLNIPQIGASDAHSIDRVGAYATEFPLMIYSIQDLVQALRKGNFQPLRYDAKNFFPCLS